MILPLCKNMVTSFLRVNGGLERLDRSPPPGSLSLNAHPEVHFTYTNTSRPIPPKIQVVGSKSHHCQEPFDSLAELSLVESLIEGSVGDGSFYERLHQGRCQDESDTL